MSSFLHRLQPLSARLLLVSFIPMLSGCFEVSNMHGQAQTLTNERQEIERQIPLYEQHIQYYRSVLPAGNSIVGAADPHYEALAGYLQRIETELMDVKANMAGTDAYLKILREETSRERNLQPAE